MPGVSSRSAETGALGVGKVKLIFKKKVHIIHIDATTMSNLNSILK